MPERLKLTVAAGSKARKRHVPQGTGQVPRVFLEEEDLHETRDRSFGSR